MRLPAGYAAFLKAQVLDLRPGAEVYLFGSRVNDAAKGGDIDLMVLSDPKLSWDETAAIRRAFWGKFGFQKLDLACFTRSERDAFKELVLLDAIRL